MFRSLKGQWDKRSQDMISISHEFDYVASYAFGKECYQDIIQKKI